MEVGVDPALDVWIGDDRHAGGGGKVLQHLPQVVTSERSRNRLEHKVRILVRRLEPVVRSLQDCLQCHCKRRVRESESRRHRDRLDSHIDTDSCAGLSREHSERVEQVGVRERGRDGPDFRRFITCTLHDRAARDGTRLDHDEDGLPVLGPCSRVCGRLRQQREVAVV